MLCFNQKQEDGRMSNTCVNLVNTLLYTYLHVLHYLSLGIMSVCAVRLISISGYSYLNKLQDKSPLFDYELNN